MQQIDGTTYGERYALEEASDWVFDIAEPEETRDDDSDLDEPSTVSGRQREKIIVVIQPKRRAGHRTSGTYDGSPTESAHRKMFEHRLLTREEEVQLGKLIQNGNPAEKAMAINTLVTCNLKLVRSIARRFCNQGGNLKDLISEGILGLIKAAELYEHEKAGKFSTYATWWIRKFIRAEICVSRVIQLTEWELNKSTKLNRKIRELSDKLGRKPTIDEISRYTGQSQEALAEQFARWMETVSLATPVGESGSRTLADVIPDQSITPADEEPERVSRPSIIRNSLDTLSYNERKVLELYYRINVDDDVDDDTVPKFKEIGKALGMSAQWAHKLFHRALRKLRENPELRELMGMRAEVPEVDSE